MREGLETELHAVFAERAREIPAQAEERLRAVDYRPRARALRPRVAIGASAALAVTAGAVVALVGLGAGASPAFAGWTATPTAPASGETAGALAQCTAQLAGLGAPQSSIPSGGWQAVLTDTRGPFTAMILSTGSASATCFSGPSFTTVAANAEGSGGSQHALSVGSASGTGQSSMSRLGLAAASSGPISQASQAHLTTAGGELYTFVQGQVDDGVSAVTLVLADGSDVQATVADGSFVAWWPGATDTTSAQVTTASGASTQQLNFTTLPGPGALGEKRSSTP
jgi:hypothetical protein